MHPILFQIGDFALPSWHASYVLGAILAYLLLLQLRRRLLPEIDEGELARLYAICYVTGYFGARLLSIFIEQPDVLAAGIGALLNELLTLGPMTFYGGFLAALLTGAIFVKVRRLRLADVADLALPSGLLALAVGRIGCFLNGDDYGKAVPLSSTTASPWWAVTFPNLGDGIARYPVQLLEAGGAALVVAILAVFFRHIRAGLRPGGVALFAIIAYSNMRFFLEFLRDDFRGFVFGTWLSTSQFISLLLLAACAATVPWWLKRPPARKPA